MTTKKKTKASAAEGKHDRFTRLRGKLLAREATIVELRRELAAERNPADVATVLKRLVALASMALKANTDDTFRPGLETIAWLASDLRLCPPEAPKKHPDPKVAARRGDVRERHKAAFAGVNPVSDRLAVNNALDDAATVDDDDEAVGWVRRIVGHRLPRGATDTAILRAIQRYRPGAEKRSLGKGKPGRRAKVAAADAVQEDRADALGELLGWSGSPDSLARILRRDQTAAEARIKALART
jgi:hypothetical protein